jgi:aminopeptidase
MNYFTENDMTVLQKTEALDKLAQNIAGYSMRLCAGETLSLCAGVESAPLAQALSRACAARGAVCQTYYYDERTICDTLLTIAAQKQGKADAVQRLMEGVDYWFDRADAVCLLRCKNFENPYEGVDDETMGLFMQHYGAIYRRMTGKKWVVLDYPTQLQAQKAGMTFEEFFQFSMAGSLADYAAMHEAALPLKRRMDAADRVHIQATGTDLIFSKKGINTIMGTGENSYIDGELYTAPVMDSVNGVLTYTIPASYMGQTFDGICLTFENGEIIRATCKAGNPEDLWRILHTDPGACFIGEFALGINAAVRRPIGDTHYDEKIFGSFHFTPGQCYREAPNGNDSAIHWDIVCPLAPQYGGGEIWFDGELIVKDGLFVPEDLCALNPQE